ncbi:hypothetical protein C9374_006585 [Naegleria lovaniensis]|uniref:ethanolamine kinase n=1 Tax=Naegleria lovaniensis TaxID=51637 RepID=A0AA88KJ09_NAELO|nr:uncharacterized protein C9374_006585 [Naegleria lovaniensis]KAG2379468.1 hypothetical protein C9374_006585 [Naegleria lovaniensis]
MHTNTIMKPSLSVDTKSLSHAFNCCSFEGGNDESTCRGSTPNHHKNGATLASNHSSHQQQPRKEQKEQANTLYSNLTASSSCSLEEPLSLEHISIPIQETAITLEAINIKIAQLVYKAFPHRFMGVVFSSSESISEDDFYGEQESSPTTSLEEENNTTNSHHDCTTFTEQDPNNTTTYSPSLLPFHFDHHHGSQIQVYNENDDSLISNAEEDDEKVQSGNENDTTSVGSFSSGMPSDLVTSTTISAIESPTINHPPMMNGMNQQQNAIDSIPTSTTNVSCTCFRDSHHENDMAGLNEKTRNDDGFWQHILQKYIHVKQLTGGTTNRLYLVHFLRHTRDVDQNEEEERHNTTLDHILNPKKVLVRCFGHNSENLIDRKAELHYIQQISLHYPELAPTIYCKFQNGLIYRYFEGIGLDELGGAKDHYLQIAKLMKAIHSIHVPSFQSESSSCKHHIHPHKLKPVVFERTHRWLDLLKSRREEFNKSSNSIPSVLDMDQLEKEVNLIQSYCQDFPVSFCHNDIGAHNIIYNDKENHSYHLIDFEYCGYNYSAFDIGNFFCEFGGLCINPQAFPTRDQQTLFLQSYFEGSSVSEEQIEKYRRQANVMSLVSNLHWSVWSMLQHMFSNIDFNYLEYAERRMQWYYRIRDETLSLLNSH